MAVGAKAQVGKESREQRGERPLEGKHRVRIHPLTEKHERGTAHGSPLPAGDPCALGLAPTNRHKDNHCTVNTGLIRT